VRGKTKREAARGKQADYGQNGELNRMRINARPRSNQQNDDRKNG